MPEDYFNEDAEDTKKCAKPLRKKVTKSDLEEEQMEGEMDDLDELVKSVGTEDILKMIGELAERTDTLADIIASFIDDGKDAEGADGKWKEIEQAEGQEEAETEEEEKEKKKKPFAPVTKKELEAIVESALKKQMPVRKGIAQFVANDIQKGLEDEDSTFTFKKVYNKLAGGD